MTTDIAREAVRQLVAEGAQLVDVRPPPEYEGEHIIGAISLPLKTLDAATAERVLERSKPVIVY